MGEIEIEFARADNGIRLAATYQTEPEALASVDEQIAAYVDGLGIGLSLAPEDWITLDTDWTPGDAPSQLFETVILFIPELPAQAE